MPRVEKRIYSVPSGVAIMSQHSATGGERKTSLKGLRREWVIRPRLLGLVLPAMEGSALVRRIVGLSVSLKIRNEHKVANPASLYL